jgi:hypothetical protein
MELREKMMAKPTRVAIEELQLQDLTNIEAAVDVKQNAIPAKHDVATVPRPPARGNDSKRPMLECPYRL